MTTHFPLMQKEEIKPCIQVTDVWLFGNVNLPCCLSKRQWKDNKIHSKPMGKAGFPCNKQLMQTKTWQFVPVACIFAICFANQTGKKQWKILGLLNRFMYKHLLWFCAFCQLDFLPLTVNMPGLWEFVKAVGKCGQVTAALLLNKLHGNIPTLSKMAMSVDKFMQAEN